VGKATIWIYAIKPSVGKATILIYAKKPSVGKAFFILSVALEWTVKSQ
jgi:hypothetical protein